MSAKFAADKSLGSSAADTEKSKDTSATGASTNSNSDQSSSSEKDKTTDQVKVLQQDLIRLTASNFETVLKELQKMTAARTKDVVAPPLSLKSGDDTDSTGTAAADRNRLGATAFQGLSGAIPLANAQLEKTVQNLASFLIHGSNEVAMRAAACINEARAATEALISGALAMQEDEKNQFIVRTQYLVIGEHERTKQTPKLPSLDIEMVSPHELGDGGEFVVVPQADYNRTTGLSW